MRQVKSVPDEGLTSPQGRGWYRNGNILPDDMFAGFSNSANDKTKDGAFGFNLDNAWTGVTASNGKFDTEPDIFSFNVKGASGKFVYDDVFERKMAEPIVSKRNTIKPQTHIFPLQDILIRTEFENPNPDNGITGKFKYFQLTTPDGTKYYFGDYNPEADPNFVPAIERSRSYVQKISGFLGNDGNGIEAPDWTTSAWYLVRIESADGRRMIKLNYVQERSGYYDLGSQFRKLNEQGICGNDGYNDQAQSSNFIKVSKVGTKSVRLASVETANLKVNFVANTLREDLNSDGEYTSNGLDANTQAKRLDAIEIRSKLSTTCRRFELNYDYFQSDGQELLPAFYRDGAAYESDWGFADKKRLRLLSVQEMACDQSLKLPKTSFEYHKEYNTSNQEIKLPRRLSMSKDYWGYFNNQNNQDGLNKPGLFPNVLPTIQPASSIGITCDYAKREPNEQAMKVGVLEKITYPMGGSVLISYEGHHTDNPYQINSLGLAPQGTVTGRGKRDDNDYNLVGGLRVKNVKTFDNSQKVAEKRFEYSGGMVFGMPVYAINLYKVRAFNRYTPSPTSPVCDCLLGGSNGFTWKADKTPIATCTPCGGFYASSESMVPVHSTQSNYHIGYQSVSVKQVATDLNGTVIDDLGKTESFYEMSRYENYKYQSDLNLFNTSTDIISSPNTFDNRPVFAGANCGLQYPIPPVPHFYERGELSLERMYNKNGVLVSEKTLSRSTDGQKAIPLGQKYMRATQFSVGRCMRKGYSSNSGGVSVEVNSGLSGEIVALKDREGNQYYVNKVTTNTIITLISGSSTSIIDYSQSVPYFSHYYIYLGRTKLDQVSTTIYDPNGNNPITTVEAYKYGNGSNHFQLIESKFKNSQNEYVITELRYPQDVAISPITTTSDAQSLGIKKLIEGYSIGSVVEKITKKAPVGGNTERVIASQITQYDPDHLTPNKVFNLEILAPITSGFVKANVQNGLLVKDSRIATNANQTFKYDIDGNIIETQSREGQGMTTAYLYGYNNRLPIAEVKNATYAQIVAALGPVGMAFVNNPTLANQDLEATLSSLRSIPNSLVSTFTYDMLNGVLSSTGPNGLKNTYQYDGLGRLLNIRDPNNNLVKSYQYNYRNQ